MAGEGKLTSLYPTLRHKVAPSAAAWSDDFYDIVLTEIIELEAEQQTKYCHNCGYQRRACDKNCHQCGYQRRENPRAFKLREIPELKQLTTQSWIGLMSACGRRNGPRATQ